MPLEQGFFQRITNKVVKIIVVFLVLAVFNSFLQVFIIYQNQEIKKLNTKINSIKKDLGLVKVEIASLESFKRIETIALNELGMREAKPHDYYWIEVLPDVNDYTVEQDLSPPVKADLLGQLFIWVENLGKTMAQDL